MSSPAFIDLKGVGRCRRSVYQVADPYQTRRLLRRQEQPIMAHEVKPNVEAEVRGQFIDVHSMGTSYPAEPAADWLLGECPRDEGNGLTRDVLRRKRAALH